MATSTTKGTFLFPVFVSVLLSDNEQDQDDQNEQQADPDAIEPAGRCQVKVTRCCHTASLTLYWYFY